MRATLGTLALAGAAASTFVLVAGAASKPSSAIPGSVHSGLPTWLAGPFRGLHVGPETVFDVQTVLIVMSLCYLVALLCAEQLGTWRLAGGIVLAHVLLLLGPIVLSQDAFGYVDFARMYVLHGLDPYTHFSTAVRGDEIYPFVGWHDQTSPYGPLFTLGSAVLVPLGVGGMVWALKAIAGLASLATIAVVALCAKELGRSPRQAAAFIGLNPVLLAFTVGGAHNDTLIVLALALTALAVLRARPALAGAIATGATGLKVSAGLLVPFLLASREATGRRLRLLAAAVATLVAVALVALAAFGPHALDFVNAIRGQQQRPSGHSVPAELARLVGLSGFPGWWRTLFALAFVAVALYCLWRTWRGADWIAAAGWTTLALVVSTAWLLTWYAVWLLPLAAISASRRLRVATLLFCAYAILYHLPFARGVLG